MDNNTTRQKFSNTTKALCEIDEYIPDDARSYVLIVIGLQGSLTVIINSLVLVSIRQTNQGQKSYLQTTKMLSTLDIIASSFSTIIFSLFTSYHVRNCNIATLLQSINIYLSQLIPYSRVLLVKIDIYMSNVPAITEHNLRTR